MATGTAAHDADPVWIYAPFRGVGSDPTNRPSGILKHGGVPVPMASQSILDDESMNSLPVEELGVVAPFMSGQSAIASARQDYHGRLSL